MTETQIPKRFLSIINDQIELDKKGSTVQIQNNIPDTQQIPIENPNHWLRIPDVICVFVDMIGSTKLSAQNHDRSTARAYQLFTGTAVRLFHEFDTPYIDVRGDGVFALFNGNQVYRALASAITFKTFVEKVFTPKMKQRTDLEIGGHIGIDQRTVLVRKIGLKRNSGRSDRQNEVWAGKPINMAAKLAAKTSIGELLVSKRYFEKLTDHKVLYSCGCPSGAKQSLWTVLDLSGDEKFDFDTGHLLKSVWCEQHGAEYCEAILKLDEE